MIFDTLSTDLQNVLLQNFDLQGKLYLIFIVLSFSLIYKFYWKPYQEKATPFWSMGILRVILTTSSTIFLWLSPLMVLYITPQNSVWNFLDMLLSIYVPVLLLVLVVTTMDMLFFGTHFLMNMAGMDSNDPKVKLFLSKINKRGKFE